MRQKKALPRKMTGMHSLQSSILAFTMAALCASVVQARGVSPYLPLNLTPEIERDIERVLILGNQPVLTRPIPAARVLDALPAACKRNAKLCARVRNYLKQYMGTAAITHVGIEGAYEDDSTTSVPNHHGMTMNSAWSASAIAQLQWGDYLLLSGGIAANADNTTPTGSYLSIGYEYAQLDVGYRDHWLSPFTDSSMLIGTQAATMPSITLSNYTPMTSIGLTYELFMAEMSESPNIAFAGGTTTGNPLLAGLHFAIAPAAGWTLSGNRLIQYGGGERGGKDSGDFLNALLRPHDYDNTSDALSSDEEFGNQQGAWTSSIVFPGSVPFSVYFEYGGEDTSYSGNYRLGNSSLSIGIDFPQLWDTFDLTYEASEWQNGWYVSGVYGDGLRHEEHVIGHWFGDARQLGDAVGGQSHMLRLGWQPGIGGVAEIRYRTLANETYGTGAYSRGHDLTLRYSYPWHSVLVGGEVQVGRDVFGDDYSRIAAFARFSADYTARAGESSVDERDVDKTVQFFADAGAAASRTRIELTDGAPKYVTGFAYTPHLAVGARRAVSDRSDLGARIEFDDLEGELLIAVRAFDYRYRINKHWAVLGFAGAARYDLATPAFGYYFGMGAQWRDIAHRLDLNLDIRYADKLSRDKLLPEDPPAMPRNDVFYDMFGATLYLSYRL